MKRHVQNPSGPLVIGLDVARFGDDATVFCLRCGQKCLGFEVYRKKSVVEVASLTMNMIEEKKPVRLFLDVGGVGGGVYDILKAGGFSRVVRGINFGQRALSDERYANRRAEMWDKMRDWFDHEVDLKEDEKLFDELAAAGKKYDFKGRLILEEKEEIKKRIGRSTDMADALALTFAEPVYDKGLNKEGLKEQGIPIEEMFLEAGQKMSDRW